MRVCGSCARFHSITVIGLWKSVTCLHPCVTCIFAACSACIFVITSWRHLQGADTSSNKFMLTSVKWRFQHEFHSHSDTHQWPKQTQALQTRRLHGAHNHLCKRHLLFDNNGQYTAWPFTPVSMVTWIVNTTEFKWFGICLELPNLPGTGLWSCLCRECEQLWWHHHCMKDLLEHLPSIGLHIPRRRHWWGARPFWPSSTYKLSYPVVIPCSIMQAPDKPYLDKMDSRTESPASGLRECAFCWFW